MSRSNTFSEQFQDFLHEVVDGLFGNERQRDLARIAGDNGYLFVKRMHANHLDLDVKALSIFRKKKAKRVYNMMTRDIAQPTGRVGIFDFKIYSDSGSKKTTFFLQKSEKFQFPHIRIRPKSAMERIGEFFMLKDVFLDYHPEFNKKFSIYAKYHEEVNDIISHELADFLLEEKNVNLEGLGNYLLMYRKNKLCPTRQITNFIEMGLAIGEMIQAKAQES